MQIREGSKIVGQSECQTAEHARSVDRSRRGSGWRVPGDRIYKPEDEGPVAVPTRTHLGCIAKQRAESKEMVSRVCQKQEADPVAAVARSCEGTRWMVSVNEQVQQVQSQGPLAVQAGTHLGGLSSKRSSQRKLVPQMLPQRANLQEAQLEGFAGACCFPRWPMPLNCL